MDPSVCGGSVSFVRGNREMPRPEKVTEVEQLRGRLRKAGAVIFTDYRGLTVAEITQLRGRLREAGAEYRVVKNRLLGIAGKSVGVEGFGAMLEGPTAAAFVADDPVSVAKILQEFMRQTRKLAIKGSVISGQLYDSSRTRALADLPGRQELLARAVGGIAAPLSGLAGVLSALPRNLVYALDQIRQQRSAA
jgi:large subunit ribosomal protein L10